MRSRGGAKGRVVRLSGVFVDFAPYGLGVGGWGDSMIKCEPRGCSLVARLMMGV